MRTFCSGIGATILFLMGLSFSSVAFSDEATPTEPTPQVKIELLAHGQYLTKIARCNDCHTPGYSQAQGQLPESRWLTGNASGQTAPPGTVYGPNIRHRMQQMTEDQWVDMARKGKDSSPMPWYNLGSMTGDDLRSIYRFVRSLPTPEPASARALPDPEPVQ